MPDIEEQDLTLGRQILRRQAIHAKNWEEVDILKEEEVRVENQASKWNSLGAVSELEERRAPVNSNLLHVQIKL